MKPFFPVEIASVDVVVQLTVLKIKLKKANLNRYKAYLLTFAVIGSVGCPASICLVQAGDYPKSLNPKSTKFRPLEKIFK